MMGWPTYPRGLRLDMRTGKVAETLRAYWHGSIPGLTVAPGMDGAEYRPC